MTPERFAALVDLLADRPRGLAWILILIYEVDRQLAPAADPYTPEALAGPDPEAPTRGLGVGHFAGMGALWRASDGRRWVLVLDSFKGRGFAGYQPQPASLVRDGLVRADGHDGGLLLVVPREHLDGLRDAVERLGSRSHVVQRRPPSPRGGSGRTVAEAPDVGDRADLDR